MLLINLQQENFTFNKFMRNKMKMMSGGFKEDKYSPTN